MWSLFARSWVCRGQHLRVLHLGEGVDELRPLALEGIEPGRLRTRHALGAHQIVQRGDLVLKAAHGRVCTDTYDRVILGQTRKPAFDGARARLLLQITGLPEPCGMRRCTRRLALMTRVEERYRS